MCRRAFWTVRDVLFVEPDANDRHVRRLRVAAPGNGGEVERVLAWDIHLPSVRLDLENRLELRSISQDGLERRAVGDEPEV